MRDAIKDADYWGKWIAFGRETIQKKKDLLINPAVNSANEPQFIRGLAFDHVTLLLRNYSSGMEVSNFPLYIEPLLDFWEESERRGEHVWTAEQKRIRRTWSINLDFYIDCFWLVGLALALEVPDTQWRRLIALIGNDGQDVLLDRIIATRTPDRQIGASLCYPRPYGRLIEVIDAPHSSQAPILAKFVERWYTEIGSAARYARDKQAVPYKEPYWHRYHLIEGGYFGYWCLEAVAAVKAFGMDDRECIGHPHYPGDLLRSNLVTAPDISRLEPDLFSSVGAAPTPLFIGEPQEISSWQALKLLVKNKFRN